MSDDLELLVNGQIYAGWTSIGVTRAIDAASGAFTVDLTERWEGKEGAAAQLEPWPILPGDQCTVKLGGVAMITGYVDIFRPAFDASSHTINVQGRDKTSDLIDCSAVHSPDQWANIDLLAFAQILAKPFGVTVTLDKGVTAGDKFALIKLQQGETAFEAISRYAKQRKMLCMPDGTGNLLLTRTGNLRAAVGLVQGSNIKGADGTIDHSQRFSVYTVKGQAPFSADTTGTAESHLKGGATDAAITRYRPMLIVAEAGGTPASVQERATWEANSRLGKSAVASITVMGWRQQGFSGPLWAPNLLVSIQSPWLRLDGEMLIRQCTFTRDPQGGTETVLEIISPQAFEPEPPDAEASQAKMKKSSTKGKNKGRNIWAEAVGLEDPVEPPKAKKK
jgi:prophage tail gpP-like protein